ncbi:MAG: glycosyltransferase [Chitinispirillales bacterium]|nr:glycosyltransferase [Chitinispirillales bacterium]
MDKLFQILCGGKNFKLTYHLRCYSQLFTPKIIFRTRLKHTLSAFDKRDDRGYILGRVDYYCKLKPGAAAGNQKISDFKLKNCHNSNVYFFDSNEFLRWFDGRLKFGFAFGDVTHIPDEPSIVKSRPIAGDNANSVVLKLAKFRHFTFLTDKRPFCNKMNKAIFRGAVTGKPHREKFMQMYFNNPLCDLGTISKNNQIPAEWKKKPIRLYDHLPYKFIFCLEGNDVASNLKWVMSSNSLAVMPRPTYETWFMEGKLIPDYHYIEIKKDFSGLEEKLTYYIEHPQKAEDIIRNANEYAAQFFDKKREKLISLLVLDKYFRMTGQTV